VNEQLKQLIELQKLDTKILDIKRILGSIPSRISEAELPLRESQAALATIKQKFDAFEKKKRGRELELDDLNEKIQKQKTRISEIKSNKEYQAYLKEIESTEKNRFAIEDEILVIMEELDSISNQTKMEEAKTRADREKVDALKKQIEKEQAEVEQKLSGIREERSKIITTIDSESYDLYISLIEACNGLAVAEAKDEICQGCNMNIPPQLFVEIKKNEEIFTCPQCRRILYFTNNNGQ